MTDPQAKVLNYCLIKANKIKFLSGGLRQLVHAST